MDDERAEQLHMGQCASSQLASDRSVKHFGRHDPMRKANIGLLQMPRLERHTLTLELETIPSEKEVDESFQKRRQEARAVKAKNDTKFMN